MIFKKYQSPLLETLQSFVIGLLAIVLGSIVLGLLALLMCGLSKIICYAGYTLLFIYPVFGIVILGKTIKESVSYD